MVAVRAWQQLYCDPVRPYREVLEVFDLRVLNQIGTERRFVLGRCDSLF